MKISLNKTLEIIAHQQRMAEIQAATIASLERELDDALQELKEVDNENRSLRAEIEWMNEQDLPSPY